MKYFSENELVEMKNIVIKSHIQQRKSFTSQFNENKSIGCQKTMIDEIDHFSNLPTEILMKIFSQLDLRDKLKSACVSKSWHQSVYDKFHWNKLCFSDWKKGNFLGFYLKKEKWLYLN